jgi:hypothetical protein
MRDNARLLPRQTGGMNGAAMFGHVIGCGCEGDPAEYGMQDFAVKAAIRQRNNVADFNVNQH